MLYQAIDFIMPVIPDHEAALAAHERLGARAQSWPRTVLTATGGGANLFRTILATPGTGSAGIALRVADLESALRDLQGRGVHASPIDSVGGVRTARLDVAGRAAVEITLVQDERTSAERAATFAGDGANGADFPLRRLDHLAATAPDLENTTRFWTDVLGVPLFGEVRTPAMIVRQMKVGDAIFELLGPATPDSPMASRPPGMAGMAAFEVPDLQAAVARARAAGFSAPDPASGTLPGTRVATIPAKELGGISMQLLQYV